MFDENLKDKIIEIARDYGVEPEALMAVIEVESNGRLGAKIEGRLEPLIRFEGHYFYRLLPTHKRNIAVTRGLASASAGKIKNPLRQSARWRLLKRAEAIDRSAALSSCSWGVGQVMGAHWRWLEYASIDALVMDARDGAEGQIRLMMRYIKNAGLVEKLDVHDWAGFARAYNGPGFAKYKYDVKMANAYVHHKGINPKEAIVRKTQRNVLAVLKLGSTGLAVRQLQSTLSKLGFVLRIDGDLGPATEWAVKRFQLVSQLEPDGIVGPKTMEMMARRLPPIAA